MDPTGDMRQSRVHRGKNTMKKERTERTNDEGLTKGRRAFLKGAVATSSAAATLGAIGFPHISPARAAHMEPRKIGTSRAMYVSRWHQIYNFSVLDFLLRVDDLAIYCAIKHIDEVLLFHFQDITTENEYRAHGIAVDYLKERSGTVTKIGAVFGSTSDVDNIVKYQTRVASLPGDLPVIEPTTDSNKFDFMVMEYEFWNHEDDPRKPPRSYSDGVARIRYAAKNGGNASSLTLSDPPDPSDRRIEVHSALGFLRDGAMNPERELDQFEVDDLFKHAPPPDQGHLDGVVLVQVHRDPDKAFARLNSRMFNRHMGGSANLKSISTQMRVMISGDRGIDPPHRSSKRRDYMGEWLCDNCMEDAEATIQGRYGREVAATDITFEGFVYFTYRYDMGSFPGRRQSIKQTCRAGWVGLDLKSQYLNFFVEDAGTYKDHKVRIRIFSTQDPITLKYAVPYPFGKQYVTVDGTPVFDSGITVVDSTGPYTAVDWELGIKLLVDPHGHYVEVPMMIDCEEFCHHFVVTLTAGLKPLPLPP